MQRNPKKTCQTIVKKDLQIRRTKCLRFENLLNISRRGGEVREEQDSKVLKLWGRG